MVMLMLLLCACTPVDTDETTDQTTNDTTLSDTRETTTENTENTENTEKSPVINLCVSDWQLEEQNYLSYEESFSTEREFANVSSPGSPTYWIKGGQKYYFVQELPLYERLLVKCYENGAIYAIPDSGAYAKYNIAGADGHYGYLYNENQFLRMDLATGNVEKVLDGQDFSSYDIYPLTNIFLLDNLVAYYASNVDNELTIGRLYLPTLKNEILYSAQGEFHNVALAHPQTTQFIVWTMLNPEFVSYLKAELADPNSKVQKGDYYDLSEIWKSEGAFSRILNEPGMQLILQDEGNQRALLKCTYNLASKELTKQTGVLDNCFHGSGMPHDHYNPEVTTAEPVDLIMGQWKNLLNKLPDIAITEETETKGVLLPGVDSGRYFYGNDYKKRIDTPVSWAVDTGSGAIYISVDKQSVFAVSYKNDQPIEIYRSAKGEITAPDLNFNLDIERQWLVIRDGDTLVQIDLATGKSRELVRHQYICPYYYIDHGKTTVYFEICAGLYGTGYTVDMETGELREHYRL